MTGIDSDREHLHARVAELEAKLIARHALNGGAAPSRVELSGGDAIDVDLRGPVGDKFHAAVMTAAALEYARRGWRVLPLKPDSKEPKIAGWPERASVDEREIRDWWPKRPRAGLGIATGRGLIVLDVDVKDGRDGSASLKVLQVQHGDLPATFTMRTPSGGWHYYFRLPDGLEIRNSAGRLGPGLDVRGDGGYVVASPTVIGADRYRVEHDAPVAEAPRWLLERLRAPPAETARAERGATIAAGRRNEFLSSEAYRLRKQGASVAQIEEILQTLNRTRCAPPLDPAEVRNIAQGKAKIAPEARPRAGAVELIRAADVEPEPIAWLWSNWLARGKLHILAGPAGTGKTTLALSLAAIVSRGGRWPDGAHAAAGDVLIWSGEDGIADTLRPRLEAAGADLTRVRFVARMTDADGRRPFDPACDLSALEAAAARDGGDVALLIVDPVIQALGAADSHKNAETRRALQPLVDLGQKLDCAVLGISHFSKGTSGREPLERVSGSLAFGAIARVVFAAVKRGDEGEGPARSFVRAKSNIGPDGGGFGYDIEMTEIGDGIAASRIAWGDPLEGSAREIIERAAQAKPLKRDEVADWLRELLTAAPVKVEDIKREAGAAGFAWRTVERAKGTLGAQAVRVSDGRGGRGHWVWQRPDDTADFEDLNCGTNFEDLL